MQATQFWVILALFRAADKLPIMIQSTDKQALIIGMCRLEQPLLKTLGGLYTNG